MVGRLPGSSGGLPAADILASPFPSLRGFYRLQKRVSLEGTDQNFLSESKCYTMKEENLLFITHLNHRTL